MARNAATSIAMLSSPFRREEEGQRACLSWKICSRAIMLVGSFLIDRRAPMLGGWCSVSTRTKVLGEATVRQVSNMRQKLEELEGRLQEASGQVVGGGIFPGAL